MQPLVLTLPDSIRDRLEAALDFTAPEEEGALIKSYEKIVRSELLNAHPAPEDREFVRHFQEGTLGLSLGSASPAIQLCNLPKHGDTGHHFVLGLNDMLGNGKRREQPFTATGAQPMHKDNIYMPDVPRKVMSMIYCKQAGYPPVPTAMATADEIIDHWAGLRVAQGKYAPDAFEQAKEELIAQLRNESLTYRRADGSSQNVPLLVDNPNYQPGSGAPRTMLCIDRFYPKYYPLGREGALHRELKTVLNSMRNELSRTSNISAEDHTVTFYNDSLVLHARGLPREVPEHEADSRERSGRSIIAYDLHSSVLVPPGKEYTPQISATGSPISYVDFVERDGTRAVDTRER